MDIVQLGNYLDQLLDVAAIRDYPNALNGVQVQNTGEIRKVGLAVDACQATIEKAVQRQCGMLLVHHGLFWSGLQPVRGAHYEKLAVLLHANVGLYSCHLPLDAHPVLGNSRALADAIGLQQLEPFGECNDMKIGFKGTLTPQPAQLLGRDLEKKIGSPVRVIGDREVRSVGLVTGGAGDMFQQAVAEGLDCYITGEAPSHCYHEAMEAGVVLILAGHYATETGGVKAVGQHLQTRFGLETEFLDHPTGM
jgi:dinuclear metal center YbgI/SA1388 family protein